jgi:hypothetical protein
MAGSENAVIAALDDANAFQEKIRARVRWLTDQLSGKELRAAEAWLEDIIRSTEGTQAALKELRRLEHERPTRKERERAEAEAMQAQLL